MNTLDADGLVLEPQTAAHAPAMFEVLSDPAIYEYENEAPPSLAWLERRFRHLESRQSADGREQWLNWVIRLPDGALAGYVQATVHADGRAAIAYELASRYWGKGLASSSVRAMIDELARACRATTLTAILKRPNRRSMRLLQRLGFLLASAELHRRLHAEADEWLMLRAASLPAPAMRALVFEPAESGDFEALLDLRSEAMRESLQRIGRFDPDRSRARFLASFSPAQTRRILLDGEPVGFFATRPEEGALRMDHLYLHPASQGRGIGAVVLGHVILEADLQALPLRVSALRDSSSNRFYLRHGFRLVERGDFDNHYLRPRAASR